MSEIKTFVDSIFEELVAIRRDIHAHPETGMQEVRTSALIREKLEEMGIVNPETKAKYTYAELIAAVSVTYSSDKPQILSIRAVSTDRNISREIANKVQEVAAKKLTEISMTRVNTGNTAGHAPMTICSATW